jgi:hypothetical protein
MTNLQFLALCGELLIDPAIALENERVRQALLARLAPEHIRTILETEF